MNWPVYPEYTDSEAKWLGQVPVGWEVRNPKTLFTQHRESAHAGDRQLTASQKHGVVYQDEYMESQGTRVVQVIEGQAGLKHVSSGDFVISLRSFQGGIEWCANSGKISPAYTVLTPGNEVVERFFIHALKSDGFIQELRSTSNQLRDGQSLGFDHFSKVSVPVPPASDQGLIADFLDRETGKIDALIDKQHQLIATLREDRTATITHAVTRGLGYDVVMNDSGVDWLGEIPRDWPVGRLKDVIVSIDSGTSVNGVDTPATPGELGVLKTSCVSSGRFITEANKTVLEEDFDRVSCQVRAGLLIINRANTPGLVGSAGYVQDDSPNLYLSDLLWAVKFSGACPRFIHWWTQTTVYRTQVAAWRVGTSASMQKLSKQSLKSFVCAFPSMSEQQEIVSYLDDQCDRIDTLIEMASNVVASLREYRSALITAAVTGKIDVRGAA